MKKLTSFLAAITICFGLTISVSAQKKTSIIPVTSVINNGDSTTPSYKIQSDLAGPYLNEIDGVSSIINGSSDYNLNTKNSNVRRIYFSFDDPVNPGAPQNQPPFLSATVPAHFQSRCSQYKIYIQNLTLNESKNCDLLISIDDNGTIYSLRAAPGTYPGTERVQWTCTGVTSGKCSAWAMTPSAVHGGERKIAMQLLKPATSGPWVDQLLGIYYMSFNVTVTNP